MRQSLVKLASFICRSLEYSTVHIDEFLKYQGMKKF